MIIKRQIDIENEVRKALLPYLKAYCRPLPAKYSLPNILITQAGGVTTNTVDTFTVVIDARAETELEAGEMLRTAVGILKQVAKEQTTAIRHVIVNTSGSWGSDPVRPDLAMFSATLLITAHEENANIRRNNTCRK